MYEFIEYRVGQVMTPSPVTIAPAATLAEAERVFEQHEFNMLPVVDGARLIGVLSKLDLLKAFAFANSAMIPPYADIMRRPVQQYMNTEPFTVDPEMPLTRALQRMVETRCKSLPVVAESRLVGVIAREDVLKALRCAVAGAGGDSLRSPRWRGSLGEHAFLADVGRATSCDARRARELTGAVFQELRDRLTAHEAADVAAQLPKGLKRLWTDGDRPRREVRKTRQPEFLGRIRKLAGLRSEREAEQAARAVFHALQILLGSPRGLEGEAWDVFSQLPKDLKKLWVSASEQARA